MLTISVERGFSLPARLASTEMIDINSPLFAKRVELGFGLFDELAKLRQVLQGEQRGGPVDPAALSR